MDSTTTSTTVDARNPNLLPPTAAWIKENLHFIEPDSKQLASQLANAGVETVGMLRARARLIMLDGANLAAPRSLIALNQVYLGSLYNWAHPSRLQLPLPPRSPAQIISQYLDTIAFPSDLSAYEFPDLVLPNTNPNKMAVSQARVKAQWRDHQRPDFLTTRLDANIINLVPLMIQNALLPRVLLDRTPQFEPILDLTTGERLFATLMGASGSGKTRFLNQEAYKAFGILLIAFDNVANGGSSDMSSFLQKLPRTNANVGAVMDQVGQRAAAILLARILVFKRFRERVAGVQPRHWLALQLYSQEILGVDVFLQACELLPTTIDMNDLHIAWPDSGFRFIAVDEAQMVDGIFPDTSPDSRDFLTYSTLGFFMRTVSQMPTTIVLSGTSLGIISALAQPRIVGITTQFNADQLALAIKARGYNPTVNRYDLKVHAGRPRLGMQLTEQLLLYGPADLQDFTAKQVMEYIPLMERFKNIRVEYGYQSVYDQLKRAAISWILKGKGSVHLGGPVALEFGACTLRPNAGRIGSFVINETLIVRALGHLAERSLENVLNESPIEIALFFEDYLAWNANTFMELLTYAELENVAGAQEFIGEWQLFPLGENDRRGTRPDNAGDEPRLIEEILQQMEHGKHLIYPEILMGPDLIVIGRCWRNGTWHYVVVMIRCKACLKSSTPQALKFLQYPYHINRENKIPTPPKSQVLMDSLTRLGYILGRNNVHVVFVAFEYPASAKFSYERVKVNPQGLTGLGLPHKSVLEIVLDKSNAREKMPLLRRGLERMAHMIRLRFAGRE